VFTGVPQLITSKGWWVPIHLFSDSSMQRRIQTVLQNSIDFNGRIGENEEEEEE
jgi:hypothetical protein